ncbi:uncharacterized protein C8orf88 homolog isoform X1 [Ictalurus punctatus]|uniref:Uncharacterized protein C8orf88 homolog isoform X1 n=2 Tax=Ictalurus punctatus TaxID=7998 RepID=A0A2D0QIN1_ICTPU|nr:uncharacterized protein C8orf88 homolog isoform X1 [Ictalurus punctatus]
MNKRTKYISSRMMEVSTRRMRNLVPARPLRRINSNQVLQTDAVAEPVEKPTERALNTITVEHFYKLLMQHSQSQAAAKPERISYSRDFLIKLANSPMAKIKPDFLPDHPIVLDKGREPDSNNVIGNNSAKGNMFPE